MILRYDRSLKKIILNGIINSNNFEQIEKGENYIMAKEKTFLIHTLKKFPEDLETLFDKFIANLEQVEI